MITPEWPWWLILLAVAMVIGVIIARRLSRVLGTLFTAVFIYVMIHSTNYPFWLAVTTATLFVILVILGLFAFLLSWRDLRAGRVRRTYGLRRIGYSVAGLALVLAILHSFWALPGMIWGNSGLDQLRRDIAAQVTETNKRVDTLVAAQTAKDKQQDDEIAKLAKRVSNLETRQNKLESRVSKLENNQGKLEDSVSKLEATDNNVTSVKVDTHVNVQALIDKMAQDLYNAGWRKGDVSVGTVDWNKHVVDRGGSPFINYTLRTQEQVRQYINGSSPNQVAARNYLLAQVPASEHARLLSGIGFIPVQFYKPVCLDGNTYFDGKHAVTMTTLKCHPAGYVLWVYAGSDGAVYWKAAIASDCGNPGLAAVPTQPAASAPASKAKITVCTIGEYKGQTPVNGSCYKPKPMATATTTTTKPASTSTSTTTVTTTKSTTSTTTTSTHTSTATCGSVNGTVVCPKTSAPQPSGVSSPTSNSPAQTAEPSPSREASPLSTSSTSTTTASDGHTTSLPNQGGTPTATGTVAAG